MSQDSYMQFASSSLGKSLISAFGLPNPTVLERYQAGQDFLTGDCLLGAANGSELADAIGAVLAQSSAPLFSADDNAAAGLKKGKASASAYTAKEDDDQRFKALIFDASGIKNSEDLKEMYQFFHPVIRKTKSCARIIVVGRTPELCEDPKSRTAQRALEGFTRSIGKEVKKGSTAQLVYVAPGAENQLESTLRFILSTKSAYVSAQVIRVSPAKKSRAKLNWDRPLEGKVALVTGASRGIGEQIARVMARDGAHVVCLDIPPAKEDLEKVAGSINGSVLAMDITDPATPAALAEHFSKEHKGVDIVVHNAGVTRDKTLGRMKEQFWNMVIDINLSSEERINDALLEANAINKGGRIIGVASISGIAGNMGQTNYGTSKAGVIGMIDSMAPILAEKEITINAVAPGFIETAMTAAIPFAIRQAGRRMNSMNQGGLPLDVAEAIAWYSNPASQGVTGNVVRVCGQNLLGA